MKYLCLVYGEEKALDALSKGEMGVLVDQSLAYDDVLRKSGHYLVSAALATRRDREDRAGSEPQDARHRRSVRRDEGTAARLHPDRRQRPERRRSGGGEDPDGIHREASKYGRSWTSSRFRRGASADRASTRNSDRRRENDATPDRVTRRVARRAQGASAERESAHPDARPGRRRAARAAVGQGRQGHTSSTRRKGRRRSPSCSARTASS